MNRRTQFPREIREIDHCWIPLPDGTRLAARIWLPVDAEDRPVPALLEYIPYRKNDGTARRDADRHPYLAGHGYAAVRVDLRGSGDSDGLLHDEYLPQELDDGVAVIAWLAAQPWCNGSVGMFGKSWGGFNALQIAALRPPALQAIITICSTDDRYADDVHYMGGCVLGSEMLSWAAYMLLYTALPPDPDVVGEGWRAQWQARLEAVTPWADIWLDHQTRDAYWRHGSVCENYAAIDIPVYAVGGWADGYTNAVPRLLAGLSGPRKGLIGPWAHNFPEDSRPGPAIGFLQESLRWWDQWLKGRDTGIMDEPMLRVWLEDGQPPATDYAVRPGRWVAEPAWPSPRIRPATWHLGEGALTATPPAETEAVTIASPQTTGRDAGRWLHFGAPGNWPPDQRAEDGRSVCFDGPVAETAEALLGFPEVTVRLTADRPVAQLAARLCDVAPGGASTLVSWGLLNLTQRQSRSNPQPLPPGEPVEATVQLNVAGYVLPAGHRWRLALSTAYWPHAWPVPAEATVTLLSGHLVLPLRPPNPADDALQPFGPPEGAPPLPVTVHRPAALHIETCEESVTSLLRRTIHSDGGDVTLTAAGLRTDSEAWDSYEIHPDDPLSARAVCRRRERLSRTGQFDVEVETVSEMWGDAGAFHLRHRLLARLDGDVVLERTWEGGRPRRS